MPFNVPQFIDIEDKIVGPFTAKQLGWLGIAGVLLLILWSVLDFPTFIVAGLIVVAIFGALAFFKPYNQPLFSFLTSGISYFTRPKNYVWKRYYDNIKRTSKKETKKKEESVIRKKELDKNKLEEISKILDQE